MIKSKIYYYLIGSFFFLVAAFLIQSEEPNIKNIIYAFVVYLLGLNTIYGYLNNEEMHFGWIIIDIERNKIERFMYFMAGLTVIIISIIGLIYRWE